MRKDLFDEQGYYLVKEVLPPAECQRLADLLSGHQQAGVRDLFQRFPPLQTLVRTYPIRSIVDSLLSPAAFAVKAILFDKSPTSNWFVTWHQDLTIAVKEKHDLAGYGPWSEKKGIVHVRPPVEILQRMITLRIHLDACHEGNGPLKVIPGSHQEGVFDDTITEKLVSHSEPTSCLASKGDCLAISPLILHASSKATNPQHRRVLHLEFADIELPDPLQWYEQW